MKWTACGTPVSFMCVNMDACVVTLGACRAAGRAIFLNTFESPID